MIGIFYYVIRAIVFYMVIYSAYKATTKEHSLEISNSVFLLLTVCLGFSVNLFSRASLYFLLVTVVDIPNALQESQIKDRKFYMFVIGVIMLAYFMVTLMLRPEWNNLYPYEFRWN